MSAAGPVEKKVQASSAAAAASGLLLFILGRYVFKGTVPDVVASWVYAVIPGVLAFAAGWLAKHTPRPDAAPAAIAKPAAGPASGAPMTSLPPAPLKRGQDISPEPDAPMNDLPPAVVPLGTPPQPPGGTP